MEKIIIFTDLDASLIDYDTYDYNEIKEFVKELIHKDIPIIPITSKTKAETLKFLKDFGRYEGFAVENGGAVFLIKELKAFVDEDNISIENGLIKKEFGININILKEFLLKFSNKENLSVNTIFDIPVKELSRMLNISENDLIYTLEREYDIPFIINNSDERIIKKLINSAERKGFKIHKGGRFYHLSGNYTKGDAVEFLKKVYKRKYGDIITVGVGDSLNDFELLKNVDYPVLVRKKDLSVCNKIKKSIDKLIITENPAPRGWMEGIKKILNNKISK